MSINLHLALTVGLTVAAILWGDSVAGWLLATVVPAPWDTQYADAIAAITLVLLAVAPWCIFRYLIAAKCADCGGCSRPRTSGRHAAISYRCSDCAGVKHTLFAFSHDNH